MHQEERGPPADSSPAAPRARPGRDHHRLQRQRGLHVELQHLLARLEDRSRSGAAGASGEPVRASLLDVAADLLVDQRRRARRRDTAIASR